MVYLNPPFPLIKGVSLLPDHERQDLLYYLPMSPHFTRVKDPRSGQNVPQFQLVRYRGDTGSGGILNFDVNVGVEPSLLEDVASECKRMLSLKKTPVLNPVPLFDGTVKMMLFGRETGDKPPEPGDTRPQFVVKISQHAKPELYGHNQAAFSVLLDPEGVSVLEKAMEGEMSPIGIVYSLEYLALRPAYNVQMNVNWDRVQKHMEERFSVNTPFYGSQIDKVVDELMEKRLIEIQVDTFVPEGDDSGSIIGRRDQAVNEIRDMITDAFFTPSLDPWHEKKDGWDNVADFHSRITRMGALGPGSDPLFSYRKLDYKRIDKKSLNVRINERSTVKRSIYPQGHLSGLFRALKNEGLDLNRFVLEVDTNHPFFKKRTLKVISRADYATDSIASLNVSTQYGNDKKNLVLDPQKSDGQVEWPSIVENGAMKRELTAQYKVTFRNVDRLDRPITLESKPETMTGDALEISPRELYSILPIKVMVLKSTFPWEQIPNVEVQLRYNDAANKIQAAETLFLDKDNKDKTWTLFLLDPAKIQYQYKLTYHVAQGRDIELAWADTDREQIPIPNPFFKQHTVSVSVASAVWDDTDRVFVDVQYEDQDNGISESKPLKFQSGDADQSFMVNLVDPKRTVVTYSVVFFLKDGRTIEIPESATRRSFITVSRNMKGHRIVTVKPKPVDFAQKKVKELKVDLEYKSGDEDWTDQFSFESKDSLDYFEFNYSEASRTRYKHKETYFFTNGLSRETDWSESDAAELILPVG
jgi:hypothetical protein